tara:strand:- start:55 stop:291 length:237 start_codon:yes stop_codon:yes gene_type:complete
MTDDKYMTKNRNMDIDTYLDQSKNLLDVYIRNNDYKGAFILLLQIIKNTQIQYFSNMVDFLLDKVSLYDSQQEKIEKI